ncbi:MAG TPA: pyridoxal-phosphate dependent enzyme [Gammaproteobacteria bacterium]|nr:pyridoxal-phosphate dependent enzyme [Gammaproteobacteria bacterium]
MRRQAMRIAANVLDAIGNTPLVQLHRVVPPGCARVLVKLEGANPTGNVKDRMAKAAIEAAEASGRLRPGDTVRASASASFRPVGSGSGQPGPGGYHGGVESDVPPPGAGRRHLRRYVIRSRRDCRAQACPEARRGSDGSHIDN